MEKYVTAADRVARHALFGPPPTKATLTRLRSDGRRVRDERTFPAVYDVTGLSMPNAFHTIQRIPVDGEYSLRVVLGGTRPKGSEPVTISLWVDEQEVRTATHDPDRSAMFSDDRQDFGGQTVEFRVPLKAGDRWLSVAIPRIFEGLPARLGGPNPSRQPPPSLPSSSRPRARPRNASRFFETLQRVPGRTPTPSVQCGPHQFAGPGGALRPRHGSVARQPSKVLHLRSSERRPHLGLRPSHRRGSRSSCVPPAARRARSRQIRRARARRAETGRIVEEGLSVGVQALLVSPDFLFRIERNRPVSGQGPSHPITQHELATRLSYFLWASMPDAELRRIADAGTLRNPEVLTAQVRRMLRDPGPTRSPNIRRAVAAVPRPRIDHPR